MLTTGSNDMNEKTPHPQRVTREYSADIVSRVESAAIIKEDTVFGDCSDATDPPLAACNGMDISSLEMKKMGKIYSSKFEDEIEIDFIRSVDYRIICRFLDIKSVTTIKNHSYKRTPLITLLLMQSVLSFMESKNYVFVGELNFDREGNSIPVEKFSWELGGKEFSFTSTGFMYFEKPNDSKGENLVFYMHTDINRCACSISSYSNSKDKAEEIICELEKYTKLNNCLRGKKIKDINMYQASFSEVETPLSYNWKNFYYSDEIRELFELEIFGFLKNIKRYNKEGINKRGCILHGRPGTGKTSIGHIICNNIPDHTLIWITPEIISENHNYAFSSIKALYELADFVSPCVILLEDLDLFSNDRSSGNNDLQLGALMNVLDGVNSIKNAITIGTTNRLSMIEKALRNRPGRFDRIIKIDVLDRELRDQMFHNRLKKWKVPEEIFNYIINETDEWTGAEIQEFVIGLNLNYIKNKKNGRNLTQELADKVIDAMKKFGIGSKSGTFGFGSKKDVESE